MTPLAQFDALLARPVGVWSLAVVRAGVGTVAALHLAGLAIAARDGDTPHGRFVHPYVSWYPVPGPAAYTALLAVGAVAAVAMAVGAATRLATAITFGVVAWHTLLSTTHVHNNRAYLVAVLLVLSMAPVGRVWSLDAWWASRQGRTTPATTPITTRITTPITTPGWPLWLLRFECALVYAASGFSKLLDPDWFGGTVTWGRVVTKEAMLRASVLPDAVQDVLLDRSFHTVAAKLIVLTELSIAAGFWWRRTRPWAVATAIVFHVMIELSANVEVFSYLGIAVLAVWADPDLRWVRARLRDRRSPTPSSTISSLAG